MEKIVIKGYDYDATGGILSVLYNVSKDYNGNISDDVFNDVVTEMNMEEDAVMDLMLDSEEYSFQRQPTGFTVTRY